MNDKHPTLLVVAAHPDDEVLGCGATVALRVAQGWVAHVAFIATGISSRFADANADRARIEAEIATLRGQSSRAAGVIGFSTQRFFDFPDNALDTVGRQPIARAIDELLDEFRPHTVFTHHPGDYNWDHGVVFDAVMMAARRSPGEFAPAEVLAFEVASSTERAFASPARAFCPNVYVDVGRAIDKKKLAMRYYEGEARPYPHPRSPEGIEYAARHRGLEIGVEYAEAFELIRRVET
ncbi:MAG: PIG-L family deacetylase [Deltaproteobacteria bacterium]|nr:PIG-L family deacetylase [Deltaproteobacteria bacterium]